MGAHAIDMISYLIDKKNSNNKNNRLNFIKGRNFGIKYRTKNKIIGQASWSSVVNKTQDSFEIFVQKDQLFFLNFSDEVAIIKGKKSFIKGYLLTNLSIKI